MDIRRLVENFADRASQCLSLEELRVLLGDACKELGFDYFALLHHASLADDHPRFVRIDNYPESWVARIASSGFGSDDPIHLASRRTNAGFAWSEAGTLIHLSSRHRGILSASRRFGVGEGFTVPVNVPGEPSGSCSFALRPGIALPQVALFYAEIIGIHAFKAARRLKPVQITRSRPHLSKRQIECVRLVALGKSDWAIGKILGISPETARQYVKSARVAYGVASRTQLAVCALYDNWIGFNEFGFDAEI